MSNYELMNLIISSDINEIESILEENRISIEQSKYC